MNGNGIHESALAGLPTIWGLSLVAPAACPEQGRQVLGDRVQAIGDVVQAIFDRAESRGDLVGGFVAGLAWRKGFAPVQHRGEVAGMPTEGERDRFERARAALAFDGVVLDLP